MDKLLLVLYLINLILQQSNCKPNAGYYSNDGKIIGKYTGKPPGEAKLILPRKVDHEGNSPNDTLNHQHNFNQDLVHYRLPTFSADDDTEYHLELRPSYSFISRALVIERHSRHRRTRRSLGQSASGQNAASGCHFRGRVRGHAHSMVALSACDGLLGYIRSDDGEFWIEPSDVHEPSELGERPHVLFKRSTLQAEGLHRKRKRKKKRRAGNCGTKEPKKRTMVLENAKLKRQGSILSRRARSISRPRHVETLLVADKSMVNFHRDTDIEAYLLTIMNMVNSIYQDPTLGNFVHVAVVRIVLLEDDLEQLLDQELVHHEHRNSDHRDKRHIAVADKAGGYSNVLKKFCRWQRLTNTASDRHALHHDAAVLVTRTSLCSPASGDSDTSAAGEDESGACSTLGVANVAGMCNPGKSCSVNQDNGITLAHTITHELGHNFGMYHDDIATGGCTGRTGSTVHVMTPSFEADAVQVAWSKCSRRDITNFLDQGLGKCLEDSPPQQVYKFPESPPGVLYDAVQQCRMQFNLSSTIPNIPDGPLPCSPPDEICSRLWCEFDGVCSTLLRPAAEGTACGDGMWCQNQLCVPRAPAPAPVHGGWGAWEPWSTCSRENKDTEGPETNSTGICIKGVQRRNRECDSPKPKYGGSFCVGERTRYRVCSRQNCQDESSSFRAEQCSSKNNESYHGKYYEWLPYFDKSDPCQLYCYDTSDTLLVSFGESVIDGTFCRPPSYDMCISGVCRKVGCDLKVGSDLSFDDCGVCGGDGTSCVKVSGIYNISMTPISRDGYVVGAIPANSTGIVLRDESRTSRVLVVSSTKNTSKVFLDDLKRKTLQGEYKVDGNFVFQERIAGSNKLLINGPLKNTIYLYLMHETILDEIISPTSQNDGIFFEYHTRKQNPHWKSLSWQSCNTECGPGNQNRTVLCVNQDDDIVDEAMCLVNSKKPDVLRPCNVHNCQTNS